MTKARKLSHVFKSILLLMAGFMLGGVIGYLMADASGTADDGMRQKGLYTYGPLISVVLTVVYWDIRDRVYTWLLVNKFSGDKSRRHFARRADLLARLECVALLILLPLNLALWELVSPSDDPSRFWQTMMEVIFLSLVSGIVDKFTAASPTEYVRWLKQLPEPEV